LLQFRWLTKKYGVPLKDVIGITGWSWVNDMIKSGNSIPILGMQADVEPGENKFAIVMYANGIEIILIVDEVIKITRSMNEGITCATRDSFKIWQFEA